MIEEWIRWEPSSSVANTYYITSVVTNDDALQVSLLERDKTTKRTITFISKNRAYRYTNETLRAHLVERLNKRYGDAFYTRWIFFEVHNSSYLQWLSDESSTISDHLNLRHFVIFDPHVALDIVVDTDAIITCT